MFSATSCMERCSRTILPASGNPPTSKPRPSSTSCFGASSPSRSNVKGTDGCSLGKALFEETTMRSSSVAVLVVAVFAPGCTQPPAAAPPAKPPEVLVGLPIRKEVVDYEEFTGRTEAMAAVEVRARATGYLEKVNFREGAAVKEGDVLFEIDDRLYRAELNRAEQTIVQNESRTKRLEQDALRERSLRNTNAGAQSDYDKVMGDLAEAQATVGWAKANRDLAKLNLSFTKVTAPLSGTIGRRLV